MMKQVITYPEFGQLEFENRILTVRLNDGLEITEHILETIYKEAELLAQGDSFCILADARKNVSVTISARRYAIKNEFLKNHLAYATISTAMSVVILVNFFLNINRPSVPSKLFKTEEEALEWLMIFFNRI